MKEERLEIEMWEGSWKGKSPDAAVNLNGKEPNDGFSNEKVRRWKMSVHVDYLPSKQRGAGG